MKCWDRHLSIVCGAFCKQPKSAELLDVPFLLRLFTPVRFPPEERSSARMMQQKVKSAADNYQQ
jgi:hypothetical protein